MNIIIGQIALEINIMDIRDCPQPSSKLIAILLLACICETFWSLLHGFYNFTYRVIPLILIYCLPLFHEWKYMGNDFYKKILELDFVFPFQLLFIENYKVFLAILWCSVSTGVYFESFAMKSAINVLVLSILNLLIKRNMALLSLAVMNCCAILFLIFKSMCQNNEVFGIVLGQYIQSFAIFWIWANIPRPDDEKAIREFLMDFPEAFVILNSENEVAFKNQEVYSLFCSLKTFNSGNFMALANELKENGKGNCTLNTNILQFRKDIENEGQEKMQWAQDYFFEEKQDNSNQPSLKKYIHVTMMWRKEAILKSTKSKALYKGDLILIFKDVSEKSALRDQILSENMKSVLISTISHELRTPLNGIIGILNMISGKIPPEIKAWWHAAFVSAQLLLNTVNCMLDFSQLELKKFTIQPSNLNIKSLFTEFANIFEDLIQKENVIINFDVSPEVPNVFRTDSIRIKQVLMNLLTNSANYTFKGNISVYATCPTANQMRIEVKDTGVGIPKEKLNNLFKLFGNVPGQQQQAMASGACKLAGLGLTISHRIIVELGGTFEVESKVNHGSCFAFTIKQIEEEAKKPRKKISRNTISNDSQGRDVNSQTNEIKFHFDCKPEQRRSTVRGFLLKGQNNNRNTALCEFPLIPFTEDVRKHSLEFQEADKSEESDSESEAECDHEINEASKTVCEELQVSSEILESVKQIHRTVNKKRYSLEARERRTQKALSDDLTEKRRRIVQPSDIEILVVDDNSINRLVLSGMLKNLDYVSKEACNGQEACKLVLSSETRFDIVLMDVQMPLMDGIEASYKIRQKYTCDELPIIAVTALCSELELQKCRDAGMNDVISKPLTFQDIKNIMQKYKLLPVACQNQM